MWVRVGMGGIQHSRKGSRDLQTYSQQEFATWLPTAERQAKLPEFLPHFFQHTPEGPDPGSL